MIDNINEQELLQELDYELSQLLKSKRNSVLRKLSLLFNYSATVQSLHGIIGGKNNTFVDSIRTQFVDFNDFFANWLKGLMDSYEKKIKYQKDFQGFIIEDQTSAQRLVKMLKDTEILDYTKLFLERNFYRNLKERTRAKPNDKLWSIWFGYKLFFGLLIAPVYRNGNWTNDQSKIRRANYTYWTIGHVLETGIIDPENNQAIYFEDIGQLTLFYRSILKRLSSSKYEKKISDMYLKYISESDDPLNEPFLIPELRYGGIDFKHKYRLDFTILNAHVMELIGFEISPASSHIAVKGLKEKQSKVNNELKEKWAKEMGKRNEYFEQFGITTITFTDNDLLDMDKCFGMMHKYLAKRPVVKVKLESEMKRLENL